MQYFSLHCADGEAEVVQAVENSSKLRCISSSEPAFRAGRRQTESHYDVRHDFGFCLKPPEVEQLAIDSTSGSDSNVTISE